MPETPSKTYLTNTFAGWALRRGTSAEQNSLIVLDNCTVQPGGDTIRSRPGTVKINTQTLTDGSSTNCHSLMVQGTTRYVGVGTTVQRGLTGTSIVTGLNGSPVTFAAASPSTAVPAQQVYTANGQVACRKAATDSSVRDAGIDGPTVAPTVSLAASQPATVAIEDFSTAFTVVGTTGSEGSASEPYLTSARSFTVPASGTERFRRTGLTLDLSGLKETAAIRVMLRVDQKQNLDRLELAFDVSAAGNFQTDFYYVIVGNSLITQAGSWVEVLLKKSDFFRTRPTTGSTRTWSTVTALQFTITATSRGPVVLSADDMKLEATTHPRGGPFEYILTFWNDNTKTRSNARSLADAYNPTVTFRYSNQIMSDRQRILIDRTAVTTTNSAVTHWQWYRRDLTVSEVFQFGERLPIAQLTANDDFGTEDLGEAYVEDAHLPPVGKYMLHHDERLWISGMSNLTTNSGIEESDYVLRYSVRYYPESFPFDQFVTIGDPVDPIRGMCAWSSRLFVWTRKYIYEVVSTGGFFIAQRTESPYGTESPYSIAPFPGGVLFLSTEGPAVFNGITAQLIADDQLRPFFRREETKIDGIALPRLAAQTPAEYETAVGAYYGGRYWLAVTQTDGQRVTLVFDMARATWARFHGREGWNIKRFSWERSDVDPATDRLEAVTSDGELLRVDTTQPLSLMDAGCAGIPVIAQTTFGAELKSEDTQCDIRDVVIDIDSQGQGVFVEASYDDGPLVVLGVQRAMGRQRLFFPVEDNRVVYKVSVRVTVEQTTGREDIFGIGCRYWLEPRASRSYSSQYRFPSKQGWLRRGRFVLRSREPVTGIILVDGIQRHSFVLPSTAGQRSGLNFSFPPGMRGKIAELRLESAAIFSVFPESYIESSSLGVPEQITPWLIAA